jgi:hypothetical protein
MVAFAAILVFFKKPRGCLIPNIITRMSSTYLLNLLNIDVVSAASSGLIELVTIWRNLRAMDKYRKTSQIPDNGVTVATKKKLNNPIPEEPPFNEICALWSGHRSAIKLKNAKAEPHRVFAIAREHKDDDDDDADGDDADGSGAN